MASGSKSDSIFTKNPTGEGKSTGMVRKEIGDGQSILSAYPQDNVHGMSLEDERGGKFRGSFFGIFFEYSLVYRYGKFNYLIKWRSVQ